MKGGEKILKQAIKGEKRILIPLMILSLALIFNFCISSVSAASGDIIYVNGSSGNDSWDGLSATWTSGTNGPKLSIKNATGAVNNGGTVNIANGNYKGVNNTKITINKNMAIIGQSQSSTIINGTDSAWIFKIQTGATVKIENLTIANGFVFDGPGIIYNKGNLTLNGCNFLKNSQEGSEICVGPIYNKGTLTVIASNFIENNAWNSGGGAIFNVGTLDVTDSNFTKNMGYGCGGAIFNYGTLTVTGSNFDGNQAYGAGGAVLNTGNLTVTGSSFTNNYAAGYGDGPIVPIAGGAIYNEYGANYTMNSSQFSGNTPQDVYNGTKPFDNYYEGYGEDYGEGVGSFNDPGTTVKAASKNTKTIGLHETGLPFNYLILAILMVIGSLVPKRK